MICAKKLLKVIDLEDPEVLFCERCAGGSCIFETWSSKLVAERQRIGRDLTLDELLALATTHNMTSEEIAEQRASWARQDSH